MKVRCEVCGNLGQLQHLSENYYRVKHYLGSVDGRLKFEYHKQSLEYMRNILDTTQGKYIDPIDQKTIDLKLKDSNSFFVNVAGGVGFEPTTTNLGGWCSIRDSCKSTDAPWSSARANPY
jgi:hypothetical protein